MAILPGVNFFVRLDYSVKLVKAAVKGDPDVEVPEIAVRVNGNGVIEGENIMFGIERPIPYDGAMTLADLVAAAQALLSGKAADTVAAVAAAPLPKP
jgi:hypothetical protein